MHTFNELEHQYGNYLQENTFFGKPDNLYDPMNYILTLGGKRIRPILALMGYNLFQDEVDEGALHVAHTVELFHNFSLIHDDIMDEAPLRRGHVTVHKKWNLATAILSGDLMLVKAYESLMKTPPSLWPALIPVFNSTASAVCEGQQKDMDFEERSDVSEAEYLDMIRQKTAVLLGASLQMGALAAGANAENASHLYQYGEHAGVAFQIMDDYLDVFGSSNSGKQAGGDILSNKKTLIYLMAMASAGEKERQELNHWYGLNGDVPGKVEAVTQIFQTLQADKKALSLAEAHYQKAGEALNQIHIEFERLNPLLEMIAFLKGRTS